MLSKGILLLLGWLKLAVCKIFHWNNLRYHFKILMMPSVSIQVSRDALLILEDGVSIRSHTEINVRKEAEIVIGRNSFLNSGCILTAHEGIYIGECVEFGSNVMVYDHDHQFKNGYRAREFNTEAIHIGDHVWIGSGTIILKGSVIGNGAVIAAGSIVNGTVPEQSLYIQKRHAEIIPMKESG